MIRHVLSVVLLAWASSAVAQDCSPATLRARLSERARQDQNARRALSAAPGAQSLSDSVLRIDADNTAFMRSMLASCDWPRISVVGEEAATAAWLLAQHADMDPSFQAAAAQRMRYAVLAREASPLRLALLVDRNRRLTDQAQVYGMQYYVGPDRVIHFYDIVNPRQLAARRAEIGLTSFYCDALQISKENGNAPIEWPTGVLVAPEGCTAPPDDGSALRD